MGPGKGLSSPDSSFAMQHEQLYQNTGGVAGLISLPLTGCGGSLVLQNGGFKLHTFTLILHSAADVTASRPVFATFSFCNSRVLVYQQLADILILLS